MWPLALETRYSKEIVVRCPFEELVSRVPSPRRIYSTTPAAHQRMGEHQSAMLSSAGRGIKGARVEHLEVRIRGNGAGLSETALEVPRKSKGN